MARASGFREKKPPARAGLGEPYCGKLDCPICHPEEFDGGLETGPNPDWGKYQWKLWVPDIGLVLFLIVVLVIASQRG